jgi:hypothetical protein
MELVERNLREAYVKAMHLQHAGESESAEKGFQVRTNILVFYLVALVAPSLAYVLIHELPAWIRLPFVDLFVAKLLVRLQEPS